MRPTQLSALRDSSQRRDSSSASSTADDTDGGDHSQSSPAVKTPAPSSRAGVASLRAGAAGSAGGSGIQPTAARRRRATAPTSARGVSTDTGGGLSPAVGASSPSAGGNSLAMSSLGGGVANGMVVEGEESAFSALEPLVPFKVYTEKDVRRELDAVKTGLEHGTDWLRWVSAMRRLAGVALGGASREFPALLVGLVRASVHEAVGHKVGYPPLLLYCTRYCLLLRRWGSIVLIDFSIKVVRVNRVFLALPRMLTTFSVATYAPSPPHRRLRPHELLQKKIRCQKTEARWRERHADVWPFWLAASRTTLVPSRSSGCRNCCGTLRGRWS